MSAPLSLRRRDAATTGDRRRRRRAIRGDRGRARVEHPRRERRRELRRATDRGATCARRIGRGQRDLIDDDEARNALEAVEVVEHLVVAALHLQRDVDRAAAVPAAGSLGEMDTHVTPVSVPSWFACSMNVASSG